MIRVERDAVTVVTVDREDVLNALDLPTLVEIEQIMDDLAQDDKVRSVIVVGQGERAFVAGGDIADLNSRSGLAHYLEYAEVIRRTFLAIDRFPKPTLGAINGYALGGGLELLLALDLRILASTAKLGLPEINLGLFPGGGGTQRLTRQIPMCRAKELMFTGRLVGAEEAVQLGIANRAVAPEKLLEETARLAEEIAQKSTLSLRMLKRTISVGRDMTLDGALAYEQAMIGLLLDSEDAHEGCSAFLENRPASFGDR